MTQESDLIRRCIEHDRRAQEELYKKYAHILYKVAMSYAYNPEDAKEVLQEGFVKLFKSLHTYQFKGSFEGWCKRVMIHTAIEYYRRNKRYKESTDFIEGDQAINAATTEQSGSFVSGVTDIIKAVNELPYKASMVLKLYAIEGYSHKEIADMLGVTIGTTKSQLNRARTLLKDVLDKQNEV